MSGVIAVPLLSTTHEQTPCFWRGGWSNEDVDRIVTYCDKLTQVEAEVGYGKDSTMRRGKIAWVDVNDESRWFMERIGSQARALNRDYFGFDLWGFESVQYTIYTDEGQGAFYDWHIDAMGKQDAGQRKLSLVLQLSDPMDYEGGELWIHGHTKQIAEKQKGLLYVFPSYTLHRVTPVTSGIRKTLVAWILGPQFR